MHILVVHAMVILLTLGPPKGSPVHVRVQCQMESQTVLTSLFVCRWEWFLPSFGHLVSGQETSAYCLPGGHLRGGPSAPWLVETEDDPVRGFSAGWCRYHLPESTEFKGGILCFITFLREHYLFPALQDLEPQQLLLFVQSFGIPVSSMSKLLQYLDQAVSHDPQTLEQNIMDKRKSADIYSLSSFRIHLIVLHLSCCRLHGPPGRSATWARCHWGAHFPFITEVFSSSR